MMLKFPGYSYTSWVMSVWIIARRQPLSPRGYSRKANGVVGVKIRISDETERLKERDWYGSKAYGSNTDINKMVCFKQP